MIFSRNWAGKRPNGISREAKNNQAQNSRRLILKIGKILGSWGRPIRPDSRDMPRKSSPLSRAEGTARRTPGATAQPPSGYKRSCLSFMFLFTRYRITNRLLRKPVLPRRYFGSGLKPAHKRLP